MGYVKEIRQNSADSHQTSPGYVLTFVRWSNRDTFNYQQVGQDLTVKSGKKSNSKTQGNTKTRSSFTVVNDAINVVTTDAKAQFTTTATAILKGGDIDYATSLHPGDFMFVNLLYWEKDVLRVRQQAGEEKPINGVDDGFKGVFRIQSVVKNLNIDRASGAKSVTYTVTAASFTEFNNTIYFNPAIAAAFQEVGSLLWSTAVGEYWQNFLKSTSDIQEIIPALFKILIGKSNSDIDVKIPKFGSTHFKIPSLVGRLLGKPKAKHISDLFDFITGVWESSKTANAFNNKDLAEGFNPSFKADAGPNFYVTGTPLQGNKQVSMESWNNNQAWSIVNGYLNQTLNEMYTTHRVNPQGLVTPTVIVRQKPFTTEHFEKPSGFPVTKFFSLPRWKVSPNLLLSMQTAKNEAARYNFVQVFTRTLMEAGIDQQDMAEQITNENFVTDVGDIERSGLRPYIVTSNFDFGGTAKDSSKKLRAKEWAQIVSDWVLNGHLKESGTLTFSGLQDPIASGDNLELDGVVYHIERVVHTMAIQGGKKIFNTRVDVSYGMDLRSKKAGQVYANMENVDSQLSNVEDYENNRLMPGLSDTQDIPHRRQTKGEEAFNDKSGVSKVDSRTRNVPFTPTSLNTPKTKPNEANTGFDNEHGKYTKEK